MFVKRKTKYGNEHRERILDKQVFFCEWAIKNSWRHAFLEQTNKKNRKDIFFVP